MFADPFDVTGRPRVEPASGGSTISRSRVPDLLGEWTAATLSRFFGGQAAGSPDSQRRQLLQRVESHFRPQLSRLRNPFLPLAMGNPTARARETVVYENSDVMVVLPKFDPNTQKVLVVPKQAMLFPTEASGALMKKLNETAAAVSDAFSAVAGSGQSRFFIATPDGMELSHMHIHVVPTLGPTAPTGQALWAQMGRELKQRLG